MKTLRLAAVEGRMFPHPNHTGSGRYVGRYHDPDIGHAYKDAQGNRILSGGWPALEDGEEVVCSDDTETEHVAHYRRAVLEGDLAVADEETAVKLGVNFAGKAI